MHSRSEYLREIQKRYFQTRSKKERSSILDEYCKNTHQNRKYVIGKINSALSPPWTKRKKRKRVYDGYVKTSLAKVWEIFDYPCGQRLAPLLKNEIPRLRQLEEVFISDEVAEKLERISPRTIDRALAHQKGVLHLKRKYRRKRNPLIYQRIPGRSSAIGAKEVKAASGLILDRFFSLPNLLQNSPETMRKQRFVRMFGLRSLSSNN